MSHKEKQTAGQIWPLAVVCPPLFYKDQIVHLRQSLQAGGVVRLLAIRALEQR